MRTTDIVTTGRRLLALAAAGVASATMLVAATTPSVADDGIDLDHGRPDSGGRYTVGVGVEVNLEPVINQAASGGSVSDLIWVQHTNWVLSSDIDGNGGACSGERWVAAETQEEAERLRRLGQSGYEWFYTAFFIPENGYDPGEVMMGVNCPPETLEPPTLPTGVIVDIIRSEVEEQLPRPELVIPPSYALTGLPAYLVTGAEHQLYDDPVITVPLGPWEYVFQVDAHGTSTVDWGDGTVTTHDEPGRHYPDGTVTHTYTNRGAYDVTVTDTWNVGIQLVSPVTGGASFSADLDPVVLEDFDVREYRAVRVSR